MYKGKFKENKLKKTIVAFISFIILIFIIVVTICVFKQDSFEKDSDKLQIVATLFPQYDLASQIVGDKANVKLLISSGVETHTYEPTAKDMITIIDNSDMFLYTGLELEPWTENIVENLKNTDAKIVNVAENVEFIKQEEFEENYINKEIISHDSHNHGVDENCTDECHEGHNHDEHLYDGHIWQSPKNAEKMLDSILKAIVEVDPENKDYYEANAKKYKEEISKLDTDLRDILNKSSKNEIAIGGEFAYAYLIEEYDLEFVSVYTNCGHGEDPNITKVKSIIDYINKHEIPVVYYEELSEGTVAKMIAEETKAEALVLYSIHNGVPNVDTYVSLFRKNIENLEKGLK